MQSGFNARKLFAGLLALLTLVVMFTPHHTLAQALPPALAAWLPATADGHTQLGFSPLVLQFSSDLQKNLFPDNAFFNRSRNDFENIKGTDVVVPQAGSTPGFEIDRTSLPATVTRRTDSAIKYPIKEFTTNPVLIQDTEAAIVSYDKRMDLYQDNIDLLRTGIADNYLLNWAPSVASQIIRTTGDPRLATAPGAAGQRKKVNQDDFARAAEIMNSQDVPEEGRCVLMPASMYGDLMGIDNFTLMQLIGRANLKDGKIDSMFGFDIYMRSRALVYNNAATPVVKAYGAAGLATDNHAALFWHERFVRRANTEIKSMIDAGSDGNGNPVFFGTVLSAMLRSGGAISREDQRGVVALVQAAAA